MMVEQFTFTSVRTPHGFGWKMTDRPRFSPTTGVGLAHDIIDHGPKLEQDRYIEELYACGTTMWVWRYGFLLPELVRSIIKLSNSVTAHGYFKPGHIGLSGNLRDQIEMLQRSLKSSGVELKYPIEDTLGWVSLGMCRAKQRFKRAGYEKIQLLEDQLEKIKDPYDEFQILHVSVCPRGNLAYFKLKQ